MELRNLPHPLCARGQKRRSEMLRALSLPEAGARNDADARRVQEAETVELVGLAAFLLGLLDGFLGDRDGGEEVHGALYQEWVRHREKRCSTLMVRAYLRILALDAFHLLESVVESCCSRSEVVFDAVVFFDVLWIAWISLLGWVDDHFDQALSDDWGA